MIRPPRVDDGLEPVQDPLDDGGSWSGVLAGAEAVIVDEATDCEVVGSMLRGVRFTGLSLSRLRLVDTVLDGCELSGAILEEAALVRVRFTRCRLSGLVAAGATAQDVRFDECRLDGANLRALRCERAAWIDCDLHEADFYGGKLVDCAFLRANLAGAELSAATCERVAVRHSTLDGLRGALSLRGSVIGSEEIVPLALSVFAGLDIRVDDALDLDLG